MRKLEICTGDPAGVAAAIEGGADRIELCSALSEGGLTPSAGIIEYASKRILTNVLIRPRPGDFVYTEEEIDVMENDIRSAIKAGANGIVSGALTPAGEIDVDACRRLLSVAPGFDNTFHRAFDLVADPFKALEVIINLGFKRILTSGQAASALEGAALISELHRCADGRIIIMAGAGVSPDNVAKILAKSNADEIHASARSRKMSSAAHHGNASMGTSDPTDGSRLATDTRLVSGIRKEMMTI